MFHIKSISDGLFYKALNYALRLGRYIGLPDDEEDFKFEERFQNL